ncbi:MAG: hypothetical protein HOL01_25760 [Planctomycetaceae bacterium]|jgi:hypothetical protein|nr:hypothetical protein [Planctomycetaceae bacterium]MBT6497935.1 hypothetical protein [Planctomycetaceae bacterium]
MASSVGFFIWSCWLADARTICDSAVRFAARDTTSVEQTAIFNLGHTMTGDVVMRYFAFLTMLLSTSLAGSVADAADPVTLRWKLKVGDTFYIENVQKMKMTTKVMDREVEQNTTQTSITQFSVTKVTPDGGAVIQQTLLNFSRKSNMAGDEDTDISELIKGVTFTITLNGKHELVKFEGYDEFVKKVSGGKPAAENALRAMVPEETLKRTVSETFSPLPRKAVSAGDISNRTSSSEDKEPRRHYEKAGGFSYDPPKAWKIVEFPDLTYRVSHGPAKNKFAPNINIIVETHSMALADYVKANVKSLEEMGKEKSADILKREDFKTEDGQVGVRLLTEITHGDLRLRQTFFFFGNGDLKYLVTFSALAEDGKAFDEAFQQSMKTFRFHEIKK